VAAEKYGLKMNMRDSAEIMILERSEDGKYEMVQVQMQTKRYDQETVIGSSMHPSRQNHLCSIWAALLDKIINIDRKCN